MVRNTVRTSVSYVVCAFAGITLAANCHANAQTPSTNPSFEVASVKPILMDAAHPFNPRHFGPHITSAGASYWSMSLANLLEHAFGLDLNQVTGPEWTTSEHFDIEARFPDGADPKDEQKMLLALLKDRFQLAFHIEKKDLDADVLVVGKRGSKLTPSLPDPRTPEAVEANSPSKSPQTIKFDPELWAMHWDVSSMTMDQLAKNMSICLGMGFHKVVNETGLAGAYHVAFDCPQPKPQHTPATTGGTSFEPQDDSALIRSLDALGLRLEKRKLPTDVYIIDHVEIPSAN